ncbi:MAG TPA: YpmA family protein [Bacillales bacterium]|nr:YpmA family protein [Bacillales bacterium]
MDEKVKVLSTVKIQKSAELYKVVDMLNRTLKQENYMFGLALDDKDSDTMVFTVYRT